MYLGVLSSQVCSLLLTSVLLKRTLQIRPNVKKKQKQKLVNLGSTTLSQLAFLGEKNNKKTPEFPKGKKKKNPI